MAARGMQMTLKIPLYTAPYLSSCPQVNHSIDNHPFFLKLFLQLNVTTVVYQRNEILQGVIY